MIEYNAKYQKIKLEIMCSKFLSSLTKFCRGWIRSEWKILSAILSVSISNVSHTVLNINRIGLKYMYTLQQWRSCERDWNLWSASEEHIAWRDNLLPPSLMIAFYSINSYYMYAVCVTPYNSQSKISFSRASDGTSSLNVWRLKNSALPITGI